MSPAELDALVRATKLVDDVWVEHFQQSPHGRCQRCGISSLTEGIEIDADGACGECRRYERDAREIARYFKTPADLAALFARNGARRRGELDCMLLYSGGKDSTYVLYQLLDMGLKVLAFTFDNGFISRQAIENIRAITAECNVESIIAGHDSMKEVFRESLARFSTVCKGCFKALLDLSLLLADERGINLIVTGLSRGQIIEERLKRFLDEGIFDPEVIERRLEQGREAYHVLERFSGLGGSQFHDGTVFDRVKLIDFFRYSNATKSDIYATLRARSQRWVQPADTGFCSSNCMINDVGIAVHQQERGYSNYEIPTAWEVRLGHLGRDEAVQELAGVSDLGRVEKILGYLDYRPQVAMSGAGLVAHYVLSPGSTVAMLERAIRQSLPPAMAAPRLVRAKQIIHDPNTRTARAVRWEQKRAAGIDGGEAQSQALSHPLAAEPSALLAGAIPGELLWSTRPFRAAQRLDRQIFSQALLQIMLHHKTLRLKVTRTAEGWSCSYPVPASLPLTFVDLSSQPALMRPELIARATVRLGEKVRNTTGGSLLHALVLSPDETGGACVTFFAHDLALDDFSWPVLLGDLAAVYGDLAAGRRPRLAQPVVADIVAPGPGRVLAPPINAPHALRREKVLGSRYRGVDPVLALISAGLAAEVGPAGRNWWRIDPGRPLGNGGVDWSLVGAWARVHPTSDAMTDLAPSFCVAMLPLEAPDGCSELFPAGADLGCLRSAGVASWLLLKDTPQGLKAIWREDPDNPHDLALGRALGALGAAGDPAC
jgi:hypothetical protein